MKPIVYFTREITPEKVVDLYKTLNHPLSGNVGIKVHSGEKGNKNFLRPTFWKPLVDYVDGTVIETNTAYPGARNTTEKHKILIREHGWDHYFKFDLIDEEGPDIELPVPDGKVIQKSIVGKNLEKYDSLLVLSHFKRHPMGGYGGALKQLSIGIASSAGKVYIHAAGDVPNLATVNHDSFLESMADAAKSVTDHFGDRIVYINVMKNLSVDCDCVAKAEEPCMKDIGMMISLDPIAIDQACMDMIYAAKEDPGQLHLIERIESRNGIHTIEAAADLGFGSREYELIDVSNIVK